MISSFPSFINIDLKSLGENRVGSYVRDEFETGPVQQRRTDCQPRFEMRFNISICEDDLDSFYDWFEGTIKSGTQYFNMKHPVTGKIKRYRFTGNELKFKYVPYGVWESTFIVESMGR